MQVLLDTSVASLFLPSRNRSERHLYEPHIQGKTLVLCFQSVAELLLLAEQNKWSSRQRHALNKFLRKFVVVPGDAKLSETWARVMARARTLGKRLETADAWIVATALRHDLPLVTHDRDQFVLEELGGRVITELRRG